MDSPIMAMLKKKGLGVIQKVDVAILFEIQNKLKL